MGKVQFGILGITGAAVIAVVLVGGNSMALAGVGNGSTILFERSSLTDSSTELWTMDGAGNNETLLLEDASDGDYSPSGQYIAFDRATPEIPPDIFVMRSDGSDIRQLTAEPGFDAWPDWSP